MASAADSRRRIKNAPLRVAFAIKDSTTDNPLTGGLTGLDAEISGDYSAFADLAAAEVELSGNPGFGYVDLAATETAYDCVLLRVMATNGNAVTYCEMIGFEEASDSGLAQSAAASTLVLRSGASSTNDLYNGQRVEIARGTGAGQVRTITDYIGSSKTATVDRAWATNPDATSVYLIKSQGGTLGADVTSSVNVTQIAGSTAAATALGYLYKGGVTQSSVNDAAASTTVFIGAAGLSASDDFYNNSWLLFVEGANAGIMERISDYVGATRTITMANAFPASPANGDDFVILAKAR